LHAPAVSATESDANVANAAVECAIDAVEVKMEKNIPTPTLMKNDYKC
jgi:hypothetical protein